MPFFGSTWFEDDPKTDEGSMFGPRPGSWWVTCPSDPRWDASGTARVGGFTMPDEVRQHLDTKQRELNMPPPADCEWGYMKD